MKPIIVNQLELAEIHGADRSTVMLWIRQGLPVLRRRGARRAHQIDLAAAVRWVRAHDAARFEEQLAGARGNPAAEAARSRKLVAEAKIAELNAGEREGELVPAADVEQRWAELVLSARERLLQLASTAVQQAIVRPEHAEDLEQLVHEALNELAARGTA